MFAHDQGVFHVPGRPGIAQDLGWKGCRFPGEKQLFDYETRIRLQRKSLNQVLSSLAVREGTAPDPKSANGLLD